MTQRQFTKLRQPLFGLAVGLSQTTLFGSVSINVNRESVCVNIVGTMLTWEIYLCVLVISSILVIW